MRYYVDHNDISLEHDPYSAKAELSNFREM